MFSAEKAMPPHSSTLAWKIPWTEEPLGLQSVGSQRVGHNWSNLAAAAAACLVIIAFASPNGTVKREHIIHTTHVYFHTEETEFILHQGEDYDSLDWSIWGKKIKIKYALLIFPLSGLRFVHGSNYFVLRNHVTFIINNRDFTITIQ